MRQTVRVVLVVALLVTAACTGNKTVPPPTASSTPSSVIVPDVVGLDFATAQQALKDAGLSVKQLAVTLAVQHVVVRQDPAPGSVVAPGLTVVIVVGPA